MKNNEMTAPLAVKAKKKIDRQLLGLLIFVIIMMVVMSFLSPSFLSVSNLTNVFRQSVFIMLLGFGMTFVLTTGGIDLSVGVMLALSGGMSGWLLSMNVNIVPAVIAGILVGMLVGAGNGLMITKLHITPFIATLATMSIGRGVMYVWTNSIPFRNYMVGGFRFIGQGDIFGLQFPIVIAIVAFVILQFVYRCTAFGRHVTAYGSNEESARVSGINTDKLLIKVYALSGLMAAIAGITLASRLETVHPEMGKGYELDAIAAAIIGGTSLSGGKGTLIGTVLGAFIIYLISNALNLLNVDPDWETIVKGIIILIVVAVEFLSHRNKKD
ncbi:ABC transporter permease [Christensenella intestinihominis]|uniref:ABC transporter permease n=1 Tax=Christensenella intestinihominis TaxID=1851429 RepID=UPI0008346979|nr:ABC transporter permease [Christensenella intestinihominis]